VREGVGEDEIVEVLDGEAPRVSEGVAVEEGEAPTESEAVGD